VRDLITEFSWSSEWIDEAERSCRAIGLGSVKTVVVFPNLRYSEKLCHNPDGALRFVGNFSWPGGAESWAKLQHNRIIVPPFPKLIIKQLGEAFENEARGDSHMVTWSGIVHLDSWRGFATPKELSSDEWAPSGSCLPEGDLRLDVSPQDHNSPSKAQARAFQHLLDNQSSIQNAVLQSILKVYPDWRENFFGAQISDDGGKTFRSGWELPEMFPPENMPEVKHTDDLLRLISPDTVHILLKEIDGFTRVGFSFRCKWDEEHELGVLTHRGNIIEVGQVDTTFNDV
jgi:hypothetical protein